MCTAQLHNKLWQLEMQPEGQERGGGGREEEKVGVADAQPDLSRESSGREAWKIDEGVGKRRL